MRRIRSRLTYANVMVTILAFIVLGGGSAVALTGSNTVFSDDIVDNQVKTADVRNDSLSGGGLAAGDLRPDSVGQSEIAMSGVAAAEVLNGSLAPSEFSSSIPAAHVTNSANQGVPATQLWTLAFDTERYDTASIHDNATNNSRLTAPVTGIYAVTAQVLWVANNGGIRELSLRKNGTTEIARDTAQATGVDFAQSVTTQVRLQANDYVEAWAYQTSVQNPLSIYASPERSPEFSMTWLAPGP